METPQKNDILKSLLGEISPLEQIKTDNRLKIAGIIDDLISKEKSKSEFAKRIKKSPSEISKWLSGSQNFTIDSLTEIAWHFNKNLFDLFHIPRDKEVIINFQAIFIDSERNSVSIDSNFTFLSSLPGINDQTKIIFKTDIRDE